MVSDIPEECPVCQWIIGKGFKKGFEKGLQQGLQQQGQQIFVRCVKKRFPVLVPLAEERAAQLEDFEVLNNMIDAVLDAKTIEEVRRILEEGVRLDAED